MRRRLEPERATLRGLLDEARLARASALLARRTHSVDQIAETLGYFEVNSFHRAFKRGAGVSPREFRRSVRHDDTAADLEA